MSIILGLILFIVLIVNWKLCLLILLGIIIFWVVVGYFIDSSKIHSYESWTKSANSSNKQKQRFQRALNNELILLSVNNDKQTADFQSQNDDIIYHTTLNLCTCPDYKKSRKPCKHMYKLAMELGYFDKPISNNSDNENNKENYLDFNIFNSKSGGYMNYSSYKVVGKNPNTNRNNTRKINAYDEETAIEFAKDDGLVEPFTVTLEKFTPPSKAQLNLANELHLYIPKGCCMEDVSCILSNKLDYDKYKNTLSNDLIIFAHERGILFSKFINQYALITRIFNELPEKEKCIFYIYCIYCNIKNKEIGNMFECKLFCEFEKIANIIFEDSKALTSFRKRTSDDILSPNKNTTVYKICNDYLLQLCEN